MIFLRARRTAWGWGSVVVEEEKRLRRGGRWAGRSAGGSGDWIAGTGRSMGWHRAAAHLGRAARVQILSLFLVYFFSTSSFLCCFVLFFQSFFLRCLRINQMGRGATFGARCARAFSGDGSSVGDLRRIHAVDKNCHCCLSDGDCLGAKNRIQQSTCGWRVGVRVSFLGPSGLNLPG